MKIEIYVEGGGSERGLRAKCRKGFSRFFREAGLAGSMPRIIACGSRTDAFKDFCSELNNANDEDFIVLLVDSERSVADDAGPCLHLKNRDKWDKPTGATDDNVHLMVQCMEAWFLADRRCLAKFFGQGFNQKALPGESNIERIDKGDVLRGLRNATRRCHPKGEYGKGRHSFDILALIDPAKVIAASPHAKRLVDVLVARTSTNPV